MIRLIRAELLKLRTTQVWFWLLLATMAVAGLLVTGYIGGGQVSSTQDVPAMFGSSTGPFLNDYILVFVLGVLGVTTEFRYQTITPVLLQTPSRWAVVTAKMITYALVGLIYAAAAVIVELLVAVPWLAARHVHVDYTDGKVVHSIVGIFVVLALFGIIGLGIGALLKNQIVAVVIGFLFLIMLAEHRRRHPRDQARLPLPARWGSIGDREHPGIRSGVQRSHGAVDRRRCRRLAAVGLRPGAARGGLHPQSRHHLTSRAPHPDASGSREWS